MPILEALILRDMLAAYARTLGHFLSFGEDERDTDDYWRASHRLNVSQGDLYAALRQFSWNASLEYLPGVYVQADHEGGLHFSDWTVRPFNAEAQLCSPN